MDDLIKQRIKEWASPPYDNETRKEIQSLVDINNEKELIDRFYLDLEFGTGGLRGVLGAGTNRMNIYNIRKVTQGLANYIIRKNGQSKGVVISRDSRIKSDLFAQTTASVLVANGIKVYFYKEIHPTPCVSFAINELKAVAGVMVTASHNPKEYNGYKVFWEDGAQVTPPNDTGIIEEVKKIVSLDQVKSMDFKETETSELFEYIDDKLDPIYYEKTLSLSIHPEVIPSSGVKICFSPLHGVGYKIIPEMLKRYGFKDVILVKEQAIPDGTFPTAPFPNPELEEAMQLGIEYSKKAGADVFIATDPDGDRIGAALKEKDGSYLLLNGNQIASLLVYYVLSELKNTGKLPHKPFMVSTIVTSKMLIDIADDLDIEAFETLTGFKWIGLKTKEQEALGKTFIFGCEESHGYNAAKWIRDKDAVNAACLFSELTAFYKSKGMSVAEVLDMLYIKYGYYKESQLSVYMKGKEGGEKIQNIMSTLRTDTPKKIGRYHVIIKKDVKLDEVYDIQTGKITGKLGLPQSNVIILELSENAKVIARPSGTEPKIKFYFTTYGKADKTNLEEIKSRVDNEHLELMNTFLDILGIEQ
jgi:phosphoglucomutase